LTVVPTNSVLSSSINTGTFKTKPSGTALTFPALACYGDCSDAWGYYIKDRLKRLITTGKGQPHLKEKGYKKKAA